MRKRRVYLILVGLLLASGVVALFNREREPEYGGKKLSEWVDRYFHGPPHQGDSEAVQAIGHIGSNAVPYLLKWIRYETPPWKRKFYGAINPLIRRFNRTWVLTGLKELERAQAAEDALTLLGPKAEAATGGLYEMLSGSESSALQALVLLEALGKAGLPPVAGILTNKALTPDGRASVGYVLQGLGTNGLAMVPALLDLLKNPDPGVRDAARKAIRGIDPKALEKVEQAR